MVNIDHELPLLFPSSKNASVEQDPSDCLLDMSQTGGVSMTMLSELMYSSDRLLAINGISLGMALISNFSLLLNMARRLSFSIAQPITILGWYISSLLLIADLSSVIHIVKVPEKRRALTQAFYYAIFAAGLYFIIASLMVITVYGAWKGHYSKEFKLTMSQRTLMLQTISFMIYMLGGAAVYAKIEGWQFLDAVYFTNYTLLTVGIGDYAPLTHLGRGLLFPYAIGGIVILGLVIGSIRSLVLERGKKKLGNRQVEKIREKVLKQIHKKGEIEKVVPIESEDQAADADMTEKERREEEFRLMRRIQEQASTRQKWVSLLVSGSAWLVLWFVGALVFYFAEHEQQWSYFQSLYFAYTTLLTIGYGDFKPFSNSGKSFFVFWSLLAVPTLTILISNMGDTVVKAIRDLTLYLGEITFLPGEAGIRARIRQLIAQLSGGKLASPLPLPFKSKNEQSNGHPNPTPNPDTEKSDTTNKPPHVQPHSHSENASSSPHEYHYLLARELRTVLAHLSESPPRKYTYDEWTRYLRLLGEDEGDSTTHRRPVVHVSQTEREADFGSGDPPGSGMVGTKNGEAEGEGKVTEWSWMGNRSPLLTHGDAAEAEWVLSKLSRRLEASLRKHADSLKESGKKVIGAVEGRIDGFKGDIAGSG